MSFELVKQLLASHYTTLLRKANQVARYRRLDSGDVLNEASIDMLRRAETFDTSRPFLPWAERIVEHAGAHLTKYEARRRTVSLDESEVDANVTDCRSFEPWQFALEQELLEKATAKARAFGNTDVYGPVFDGLVAGLTGEALAKSLGRPASLASCQACRLRQYLREAA